MVGMLCRYFRWAPDFWRARPAPYHSMGWNELMGWLEVAKKQTSEVATTPDSWDGADRDGWWVQARQKRNEARGWG